LGLGNLGRPLGSGALSHRRNLANGG
jgi:hypothetical protein